jgi:hypothetical protein
LGRLYVARQTENVFYRDATFYSAAEVATLVERAGFRDPVWLQTLSAPIASIREIEPTTAGRGRGAFLVLHARISDRA